MLLYLSLRTVSVPGHDGGSSWLFRALEQDKSNTLYVYKLEFAVQMYVRQLERNGKEEQDRIIIKYPKRFHRN